MKRGWILLAVAAGLFAGVPHLGFGAVMHEYGLRFWSLYYAAKAGNAKLAAYEMHEMLEAQEAAEALRPRYAKELKAFEKAHLEGLEKAINGDFATFKRKFSAAQNACNACHVRTGHPYIRYELPATPPPMLKMEP